MGVYRRMSGPHKDPKDLFVSVKEDGDKAVMYTPSGVKVFHRKEVEEVEEAEESATDKISISPALLALIIKEAP